MKTCIYDSPKTMCREAWQDGELIGHISANLLAQKDFNGHRCMSLIFNAGAFEPGRIIGDDEALTGEIKMYNNFEHLMEYVSKNKFGQNICFLQIVDTFIDSNGEQCWTVKIKNDFSEKGYDAEKITISDILLHIATISDILLHIANKP